MVFEWSSLNVNIPSVKMQVGIKVCRQAKASWVEEFDKKKNPFGQDYCWLTGKFVNKDKGEDTDDGGTKSKLHIYRPYWVWLNCSSCHSGIKWMEF